MRDDAAGAVVCPPRQQSSCLHYFKPAFPLPEASCAHLCSGPECWGIQTLALTPEGETLRCVSSIAFGIPQGNPSPVVHSG